MPDLVAELGEALAGGEGWVVGGALRDELLGRQVVDIDVACREPERAARAFARARGGAPFPLSERHGAWRIALEDGMTVDFTPLPHGIEEDLAGRDFTLNAMARPLEGGELVDPFGGRADIAERAVRAVSAGVFEADPLRLLRAVRLEDELGFRLDAETEELVRRYAGLASRPTGERILGELERLSTVGYRRLAELGLLDALGGSAELFDRIDLADSPDYRLVCVFGERLRRLPISRRLDRYGRTLLRAEPPADGSPRAHPSLSACDRAVVARRARVPRAAGAAFGWSRRPVPPIPRAPLLRGDELGLPPGPEVGRMLELIAEERAAGSISTREEALELVRREAR